MTGASPVKGWAEPTGLQSPAGLRSRSPFLPVCLQGPTDLLFRLPINRRLYRLRIVHARSSSAWASSNGTGNNLERDVQTVNVLHTFIMNSSAIAKDILSMIHALSSN